ncbi:MAG TPA: hypothetical protein VHG30_06925 [Microvirga sp.]|nr:hypothetical protein [Microvirga sp.]
MMDQVNAEVCATIEPSALSAERPDVVPSFVDALVDPGSVFRDPAEVVEHPFLTDQEKRTILLSWARDELAIEQVASKSLPELRPRSRIDALIEALSRFDPSAAAEYLSAADSIRCDPVHAPGRKRLRCRLGGSWGAIPCMSARAGSPATSRPLQS